MEEYEKVRLERENFVTNFSRFKTKEFLVAGVSFDGRQVSFKLNLNQLTNKLTVDIAPSAMGRCHHLREEAS